MDKRLLKLTIGIFLAISLLVGIVTITADDKILDGGVGLLGVGDGTSNAPADATYITQTADGDLTNEQAMGALSTGIVKNTTTSGVQSIAVAGTDYSTSSSTESLTNKTLDSSTNTIHADTTYIDSRNVSGSTITGGSPVYASGYNAGQDKVEIDLSDADVSATMPAIGILESDILNNANGHVIASGVFDSLDTTGTPEGESWSVGDTLYVSATLGELTNVKPTGTTELIQAIAKVVRSHATLGRILVQGAGRTNDVPNSILTAAGWADSNPHLTVTDITDNVSIGTNTANAKLDVQGSAIFNDDGADVDFRVEGDTEPNLLVLEATNNNIGMGTSPDATTQLHLLMDSAKDIHIDGSTNQRTIDTGTLRFTQTPSIPNTRCITKNIDINSQHSTHADVINLIGTGLADTETATGYQVNLDASTSTGGVMRGLSISKSGPGSAVGHGIHIDSGMDVISHFAGTFINVERAWDENGGFTDVTTAFNSTVTDVTIFDADNDMIHIGMDAAFNEIQVNLDTFAGGAGIFPTFEYSSGGGTPVWTVFTAEDETQGFRQNGLITWVVTDLVTPTWAVATINAVSKMYIRITRTQNTIPTDPIEDTIQVASTNDYEWDATGDLTINSVDVGASVLATRSLTIDTGGVFNVALSAAAGDDFTIDTNKFLVEGDTGNIGIGTETATEKLQVEGNIKTNSNFVVEGSIVRSVLRAIELRIEPGATPGTNIDVSNTSTITGFNPPTITNATDLAKSGTGGSFSLSADGKTLTLDITENIIGILNCAIQLHKINTGVGGELYVSHAQMASNNMELFLRKSDDTGSIDLTALMDAGDRADILISFITSS